jgi:hypothetical protein
MPRLFEVVRDEGRDVGVIFDYEYLSHADCGLAIADCGLRLEIDDCGLVILLVTADCRFDCGLAIGLAIADHCRLVDWIADSRLDCGL